MKKCLVLSLFLSYISSSAASSCSNSTSFHLIFSEDKKAFGRRQFHIFYERSLESVAETIKCHVSGTVKNVNLEKIDKEKTLDEICESKKYSKKLEDKLHKNNYMVTITKQKEYIEPSSCEANNQFNLMKTPQNEWAVQIRGIVTEILLPLDSSRGGQFTQESLNFALNALFFATGYGYGTATFKSLSDGNFKVKMVMITGIVYLLVVLVAVVALCILFGLFLVKRRRNIEKRETEKSNLLRNQANNSSDDTPVVVALEDLSGCEPSSSSSDSDTSDDEKSTNNPSSRPEHRRKVRVIGKKTWLPLVPPAKRMPEMTEKPTNPRVHPPDQEATVPSKEAAEPTKKSSGKKSPASSKRGPTPKKTPPANPNAYDPRAVAVLVPKTRQRRPEVTLKRQATADVIASFGPKRTRF